MKVRGGSGVKSRRLKRDEGVETDEAAVFRELLTVKRAATSFYRECPTFCFFVVNLLTLAARHRLFRFQIRRHSGLLLSQLQIGLDHDLGQFLESNLRLPAQLLLRFGGISD